LPSYSLEQLVEAARMQIRDGHTQLKMAVAVGANADAVMDGQPTDDDIIEDAARIRCLREALGDGITLMIDANKRPRLTQAAHLARLVEPFDVAWFEDPLIQADPRLLAQLRRKTSIPIAAGSTGTFDITILRE
jgi:L-rhamnonate dehydratase